MTTVSIMADETGKVWGWVLPIDYQTAESARPPTDDHIRLLSFSISRRAPTLGKCPLFWQASFGAFSTRKGAQATWGLISPFILFSHPFPILSIKAARMLLRDQSIPTASRSLLSALICFLILCLSVSPLNSVALSVVRASNPDPGEFPVSFCNFLFVSRFSFSIL